MLILENLSKHIFEISDKPQNFTFPKISHSMVYKIMYIHSCLCKNQKDNHIRMYVCMYICMHM